MGRLLTDAMLARIGTGTPPVTEQVTRRDIRRYAVATRQRLPRHVQGDEAPPMFYSRFFEAIPSLDSLKTNGQAPDPLTEGLPLARQMAGGCEVTYHRPIRPGDTLTATRRLVGLEEKEGRQGTLIFCRIRMDVTDERGEPVVTELHTRILR